MARKSIDLRFLRGKVVEVISDDDDDEDDDVKFYQKIDDDDDDDDGSDDFEETLTKYSKPVAVYKIFAERSKNRPLFLRRCLKYVIQSKKENTSSLGGTIIFNYMDRLKKILKSEVVKKFSCPFCLMLCGGQGGMQYHLESTHDVFNYDFWDAEEEDHPEVDVTLKYDENSSGEEQERFLTDHNKIPYYFCSRRRRKRNQRKGRNKMKRLLNVRFLGLDLNELPSDAENESTDVNDENISSPPKAHSPEETREIPTTNPPPPQIAQSPEPLSAIARSPEPLSAIAQPSEPIPTIAQPSEPIPTIAQPSEPIPTIAQPSEPIPTIAQPSEPLPTISQPSKAKVTRSSKRTRILAGRLKDKRKVGLQSRQFYHSLTKQPMTLDEVMSNVDSENEEDDYYEDIIERMRLLQIANTSKEEKHFMHLWNIFIRKRRVIAHRYVPLACEEFTKLHKQELLSSTSLSSTSFFWWWTIFKIKLWKLGLISSANTIDKCSIILQNTDEAGPSASHGVTHRNSDEAGPSTSHGSNHRNSDEAGPSTSHGYANPNTEQWMEVD